MRVWMGEAHHHLAVAVQRLRAAVFARDPRVDAWVAQLTAALHLHMAEEERWILPRYAALGGPCPENGTLSQFAADHALLREALAGIALPGDGRDASIRRCEAFWRLHGVLEHHDAREMRYLVPRLEASGLEGLTALDPAFAEPPPDGPYPEVPAGWASDLSGEAVDDLQTALAGAAPIALVAARVVAVCAASTKPKQRALGARLTAAVAGGDRALAWDALRLVRAAGLPPRAAAG